MSPSIDLKHMPTLTLKYPSMFDYLEHIVDEAQAFLEPLIEDEDLIYKIVLLTSEAATNAMEHGNDLDASKQVRVSISVAEAFVEVQVEDEGEGFNPRAVENPLAEDNLMSDSGRGVFLMEQMADIVRYENKGRRLVLRFRHAS